ncbi:MAG: methyltransferase domain-containing protein [Patescibacteria group bacterium]
MVKEDIAEITKEAWVNNWKEHSVKEVLQIFEYTRVQRLLSIMKLTLPKDGSIIEGGCGLGPWVIKLRELGYDMVGIDYDAISINKLGVYDKKIPLAVSDIENIPFKNSHFVAYISLGVLEHFHEGPEKAISEAQRILKPGGLFFVVVPNMSILLRLKLPIQKVKQIKILRKIFRKKQKIFYYERYFKINEIKHLLEKSNFDVMRIFPFDHIFSFVSFSSVFRKKGTYDGENNLAIKFADFFSKILPWQTAGSIILIAKKT